MYGICSKNVRKDPQLFSSLEKALDILCLFDIDHQPLSAREISNRLGMPLSSAYKYLDVLLRKGLVTKDKETKKFFLGLTIFRMGNLAACKITMIDIAVPHMNSLSKRSEETVVLTVPHGWEGLCLEVIESPRMVKLTIKRGVAIALHAGASQKILLAFQDESFINAMIESIGLPSLNANTITDPQQLKTELKTIRERGYSVSDSEVDLGAAAAAAPIFDHRGRVMAGVTIAGPSQRIFGKNSPKLIEMVKETAKWISHDLGYMPDKERY